MPPFYQKLEGGCILRIESSAKLCEFAASPGARRAKADGWWGLGRAVVALLGAALLLPSLVSPVDAERGPTTGDETSGSPIDLPVPFGHFIENAGQLRNHEVRFYSASGVMQVGFAESAVLIAMIEPAPSHDGEVPSNWNRKHSVLPWPAPLGASLRLDFEGANRVIPLGRLPLLHVTNFFFGVDPAGWRTGVHSYAEIVYEDLYDGIDLVYRIGADGLKYDFIVRPDADPSWIRMGYVGIDSLDVSSDRIVLSTVAGELRDEGVVASAGGDVVRCAFEPVGIRAAGFACEGWDRTHPLVIDPLLWATFLGGSREEESMGLALDNSGNPVVAGWTYSTDFPTTTGAYDVSYNGGFTDAFVVKLSADGASLLWATYLGGGVGDANDGVFDLALDGFGDVLLAGDTYSRDFPATTGAYDTSHNGAADAFAAKLSADGSSLLWATYLGGGDADHAWALTYNGLGELVVGGETRSIGFPATPGAFDVTLNGLEDAFVAKLSADGASLLWATFLGGSGNGEDEAYDFAFDTSGNPVVAGVTYSPDFPTTAGAYDVSYSGGSTDAFVAKLSADGSALLWSTFLGGGIGDGDGAWAIALDASGNFVVAGRTLSSDFPVTPGAFDTTYGGDGDAFMATLSADGSSLLWSTLIGGSGDESVSDFVLDRSGDSVAAGSTFSWDFPITSDAIDNTLNGFLDIFVARLSADGSSLLYSTYLGGNSVEGANRLVLDASGDPVITGRADSADFPVTTGAFDVTLNGSYEVFVAKLDLQWGPGPPEVTITSPADATWFTATGVTISGNTVDGGGGVDRVEVSCDDGTTWGVAVGTIAWTHGCTGLTEGANRVSARAFDLVGRESAHILITVNVDLTPPLVIVTSPAHATWINTTNVAASGSATDVGSGLTGVEVSCDGGATWKLAEGTSTWSYACTALTEGANAIRARAFDLTGFESAHDILIVNVDLTPPTLTITSPADGEWFGTSGVVISGTAMDPGGSGFSLARLPEVSSGCTLSLNHGPDRTESSWMATCSGLTEGSHQLYVRFFDGVGWDSLIFLALNVDLTLPVVTATSPDDGTWVALTSGIISGNATDAGSGVAHIEVSCDGGATWNLAPGRTTWTYVCAGLTEGANAIRARAFDVVGRESAHDTLTVNVDLTSPTVTTLSPAAGTWFNTTRVTISGSASDTWSGLDRIEVSCDDGTTWIVAGGRASWTSECVDLPEGANTVLARAFDLVGWKSADATFTVNVDLTPPTVTIVCLPPGAEVGARITCTIAASDNLDAAPSISWTVTRGGFSVVSGSGTTAAFTSDRAGSYVIVATSQDLAQNPGAASATVTATEAFLVGSGRVWILPFVVLAIVIALLVLLLRRRKKRQVIEEIPSDPIPPTPPPSPPP